jgi:4-amino-4-deoxy-L-arabinose transferase-like glycosyltransferase
METKTQIAPRPEVQHFRTTRTINLAVLIVSLIFASILLRSAWRDTLSEDETFHIPAGVNCLDQGDSRMNRLASSPLGYLRVFEVEDIGHPPLIKILAGVGAKLAGARADGSYDSGASSSKEKLFLEFQDRFAGAPLRRIVAWARVPMVGLTLLLAWLVYTYGRKLAGPVGGLVSILIFVSFPLILAFGALVLNDVAVTLTSLLTCLACVGVWRRPNLKETLLYGTALGLALLSKFSALILLPYSVLCWAMLIWHAGEPLLKGIRRLLPSAIAGFLVAAALVWTVYFVTFGHANARAFAGAYFYEPIPAPHSPELASARGRVQAFVRLDDEHPTLERVLMPALYYGAGVRFTMVNNARPVYLLGKAYRQGQWFYFPVVTAVKSPLGFLLLLALSGLLLIRRGIWRSQPPEAVALTLFFAIYTATALTVKLNIGLRHFLPSLVSLMILMAMLVPAASGLSTIKRNCTQILILLALVNMLTTAVLHYPYYVPYYNVLSFARPHGWIASKADIDFGSSLQAVQQFAREQHINSVDVFPLDPHVWHLADIVPAARDWQCDGTVPSDQQWVIVSVNQFYNPSSLGKCDYLLRYPHRELAGGSLEAFDIQGAHRTQAGFSQ